MNNNASQAICTTAYSMFCTSCEKQFSAGETMIYPTSGTGPICQVCQNYKLEQSVGGRLDTIEMRLGELERRCEDLSGWQEGILANRDTIEMRLDVLEGRA